MRDDDMVQNMTNIVNNWNIIFDKRLKAKINNCCIIDNPLEKAVNITMSDSEENMDTVPTTRLNDESFLNLCEDNYSTAHSINRKPTILKPIVQIYNRNSTKFPVHS